MKRLRRSAGGRLGIMAVDQVISGASNVLIAVLAARLLSAAEFGLFGIVFLVYTILVGITRALVSDPLLLHPRESRARAGEAIGATCILAVPLTAVLIVAGVGIRHWNTSLGDSLVVLAAFLPLLLLQDLGRYLAFATQRPMRAVILDSAWFVLVVAAAGVVFSLRHATLVWFIAVWGGSGAIAGLLLFIRYREMWLTLAWLRDTWALAWRFLVSYTAMQGSALGVSSEVGAIAGTKALGGVQGALLLARPFTTFQVAAATAAIGEVARSAADTRRIWRHVTASSIVTGGVAGLNLAFMLLLPRRVGETILGASWQPAHPLLLPTGLYIVCIGLLTGPAAALLGLRAMRTATRLNVTMAVVSLAVTAAGAAINGALGAMWLAAGGQAVMMVAWWAALWIHLQSERRMNSASLALNHSLSS